MAYVDKKNFFVFRIPEDAFFFQNSLKGLCYNHTQYLETVLELSVRLCFTFRHAGDIMAMS